MVKAGVKYNMLFNMQVWNLPEKTQTNTAVASGCVATVCLTSRFTASPTMRGKCVVATSPAWGLNGAAFQFSEGASAQSQAPGQVHLWLECIRKGKCSARFCSPEHNFIPGSHGNPPHPGSHRLRGTIQQLRTVVISSFVPKGYIYLGCF